MPGGFRSLDGAVDVQQIATQIATIQDSAYPQAEHELPRQDIEIPVRDDYRRHEMVGLNAFLLEMFDQFDDILGVAETDYMTSAANGNEMAIENIVRQAREETVDLHRTVLCDPAKIVPKQVNDHQILGAILLGVGQP